MKIDAKWLDVVQDDAPELSATACELAIEVGARDVCRLYDKGVAQDHPVLPAYPLAEGLAMNWWWLMAGRSGALGLRSFREGFAVPDVIFTVDGHSVVVEAKRYQYDNPPVSFVESAKESLSIQKLAHALRTFITDVVNRLDDKTIPDTVLAERWADIRRSQSDPEEMEFCEAAGAMGIDPYLCSDADIQLITDSGRSFNQSQLAELLSSRDPSTIRVDLDWVRHQEQAGTLVPMPDLAALGRDVRGAVAKGGHREAWGLGYATAMEIRRQLDLAPNEPLAGVGRLVEIFGGVRPPIGEGHGRNIRAAVRVQEGQPAIVVGAFKDERSRAFALARAVGDYLVFGREGRSPVMSTHSYQQAVGRAFAAEVLAPGERVRTMRDDGWALEDIADEFQVSDRVITHQLENLERLHAV
ncbi:MAG: hypothetical protein HQL40_17010 [Alphaproteobacteria bacterium]|nr:hypothetical protein [Alphaproteobacteria bacterium]